MTAPYSLGCSGEPLAVLIDIMRSLWHSSSCSLAFMLTELTLPFIFECLKAPHTRAACLCSWVLAEAAVCNPVSIFLSTSALT